MNEVGHPDACVLSAGMFTTNSSENISFFHSGYPFIGKEWQESGSWSGLKFLTQIRVSIPVKAFSKLWEWNGRKKTVKELVVPTWAHAT